MLQNGLDRKYLNIVFGVIIALAVFSGTFIPGFDSNNVYMGEAYGIMRGAKK